MISKIEYKKYIIFKNMLYITHNDNYLNEICLNHPENSSRLDAISDQLISSGVMPCIEQINSSMVSEKCILRVHSQKYLDFLKKNSPEKGKIFFIDSETMMNYYSLTAALYAAGSGILGVDHVMSHKNENVFCAVRPPGHHASKNKGMGFCLLNNIAIAVQYSIDKYNLANVAIIDFDAHHGNGTEQIFCNNRKVHMYSFFQEGLFPDSFKKCCKNMFNKPLDKYSNIEKVKDIIINDWIPNLHIQKPELIFISAGFDAHCEDSSSEINLKDQDYFWITNEIVKIADLYSNGRIVSLLEGGYHLSSLGRSVVAHIRALAKL